MIYIPILYDDSKTLASVNCQSGIKNMIQYALMTVGNCDICVKSVDKNGISSMRSHGLEILHVVIPKTKQVEGRLVEKANFLDYWSFFMAKNLSSFPHYLIFLVLPNWNLREFQSHCLKQTIFSILSFCNSHDMLSIAFPILCYKSKNVPLTVFARLLLQAIGDFSLCFQTPNLRDIRIISNDSCIDTFLVHFLSPISQHLTKFSIAEQSVRKEEEEEICGICLDTLYSGDTLVRRLSQCKHVFHEECVSRAIKTRPVCPLCTVPLGLQRGNQPYIGVVPHYVLSHSLPGYQDCNTIQIQYDTPAGIQTQFHPNPGVRYYSATRIAYLPNNSKGQWSSTYYS